MRHFKLNRSCIRGWHFSLWSCFGYSLGSRPSRYLYFQIFRYFGKFQWTILYRRPLVYAGPAQKAFFESPSPDHSLILGGCPRGVKTRAFSGNIW